MIILNGVNRMDIYMIKTRFDRLMSQEGFPLFSVAQLCPPLCNPTDFSTLGFPVFTIYASVLKLRYIELVMPFNHLILCHPLLLLPSIFPSIRVFPNEPALRIRWPKYWSFSFSISPSNEYSGLISFRIDWFAFLALDLCQQSDISSFQYAV